MDGAGVSTELELSLDPWKIKKELTPSAVDHSSRLVISRRCVKTHVLPHMSREMQRQVELGHRVEVTVRDEDTRSEHRLMFRYRPWRGYKLKRGWKKLFVNRRGLEVGDEIGIYWDNVHDMFHFMVRRRARH